MLCMLISLHVCPHVTTKPFSAISFPVNCLWEYYKLFIKHLNCWCDFVCISKKTTAIWLKFCKHLTVTPICACYSPFAFIVTSGEGFPLDFVVWLWGFVHWRWLRRLRMHPVFEFISKAFSGVEVRILLRPPKFVHSFLG